MNALQKNMLGHGAVIMIIALSAGFGLAMSLIGGFELFPGHILHFELPGDSRAWARAHSGGMMNGMMVMLGAIIIWAMEYPDAGARRIRWMLVGAGYANSIFYWVGMLAGPHRSLRIGDNPLGESSLWGVLGFLPAFIFAFVTLVAFSLIARQAFLSADE